MNPLLTALLSTLLLACECLFANPFNGLGLCGVHGRTLTVLDDHDPVLPKGKYFEILRLDDHSCEEQTWLFLADPDLYSELKGLHKAGVQIVLYFPSALTYAGQIYSSNGISVRPDSPTIKVLFPNLDSRKSTLFVSPSTSIYDLHHEIRHLWDFLQFFPSVAASLSGLKLQESDFVPAFLFILELRAYAQQIGRMDKTRRGLDFYYDEGRVKLIPGPSYRRELSEIHKTYFRTVYAQPLRQMFDRLKFEDALAQKRLSSIIQHFVSADDIQITGVGDLLPEVVPCQADLTQ